MQHHCPAGTKTSLGGRVSTVTTSSLAGNRSLVVRCLAPQHLFLLLLLTTPWFPFEDLCILHSQTTWLWGRTCTYPKNIQSGNWVHPVTDSHWPLKSNPRTFAGISKKPCVVLLDQNSRGHLVAVRKEPLRMESLGGKPGQGTV